MDRDLYTSLDREVAVVTGGAGYLGSEFCRTLQRKGAKVVSVDLKKYRGEGDVGSFICDITDKREVKKTFASIQQKVGIPTILVNCAGIDSPPRPGKDTGAFEDVSEAFWDTVIDSHLKGAFFCSQEFMRIARKAKILHGSIITISSIYGVVSPDQTVYSFLRKKDRTFFKPVAYSVAKSGILNFSRWLAEYGAPFNIRANTLVLGGVANGQSAAFLKAYKKRNPLGRMARKEEYNGALLFLASPVASSYVTGSALVIDGGYLAR